MEGREIGIFDAEGFFRTGRRPDVGFPLAEIYALSDAQVEPQEWDRPDQERLPEPVAWDHAYFREWAEALVLGYAGDWFPPAAWVIVVFDEQGRIAACVEYRPVLFGGALRNVSYADARQRWIGRQPGGMPRSDSCQEPAFPYRVDAAPA